MENVRSQTYSKELPERPPHTEPWGALRGDQRLTAAGARGRPEDGLRLEVKSPEEEERGYIVTEAE